MTTNMATSNSDCVACKTQNVSFVSLYICILPSLPLVSFLHFMLFQRGNPHYSLFRHTSAVVLEYDETNKESFEEGIERWRIESVHSSDISIYFLIGNKNDLVDSGTPRAVSEEQAQDYANSLMIKPLHISALTGDGCDEAFQYISDTLFKLFVSLLYSLMV